METVKKLVKVVARKFYQVKFWVFLDYLLRERVLSEDALASRLQLTNKDVNKIAVQLLKDRLIQSICKSEARPYDGKLVSKSYYYIDFGMFVDVVRWRLYLMRQSVQGKGVGGNAEGSQQDYCCPNCHKLFSAIDIASMLNVQTGQLECIDCGAEIEKRTDEIASKENDSKLLAEMIECTKEVTDLLRQLDDFKIGEFNAGAYLLKADSVTLGMDVDDAEASLKKGTREAEEEDERKRLESVVIPIAGSDARSKGIKIELRADESAPQQPLNTANKPNDAIPQWHKQSTVTGKEVKAFPTLPTEPSLYTSSSNQINPSADKWTMQDSLYLQNYHSKSTESLLTTDSKEASLSHKEALMDSEKNSEEPPIKRSKSTLCITVAGVEMNIDDVTETEMEKMTSEEYTQYFSLLEEQE